jgi:hypothetical protein
MGATEDSKALMWRITDEIWNKGRFELIDELIAEDLVDHVELAGLDGMAARVTERASRSRAQRSRTIRTRSISSFPMVHSPFPGDARKERIAASSWG